MLRFNRRQLLLIADTLRQLANIVAGTAVVGQFVRSEPFSPRLALVGILSWWVLVIGSVLVVRTNGESGR